MNWYFPVGFWSTTVASHLYVAYRSDPDPSRVVASSGWPLALRSGLAARQSVLGLERLIVSGMQTAAQVEQVTWE